MSVLTGTPIKKFSAEKTLLLTLELHHDSLDGLQGAWALYAANGQRRANRNFFAAATSGPGSEQTRNFAEGTDASEGDDA